VQISFEVWNISVTTPTRFRNAYYLFNCCIMLHSLQCIIIIIV